jgi:tripartite-type tricarboxylate transporter receptor subunit TctC
MAITEFQEVLKARRLHRAGGPVNFRMAHTSVAEKFRMKWLSAFLAALIASVQIATAQDYPARPITLIVPLAAGGGADIVSRIITERMRVSLGQPIVIENIPAAAGTVALARLARATPDGYTLSTGDQTSHVISSITNQVQYDVMKDFAPISLLSTSPVLFVGRSSLPQANLRELIDWLRANPGKASLGTTGQGGGPHIVGGAFQANTATQLQVVPYRGVAPALQDLMAGHVDLLFVEIAGALPYVREGKLHAYAVLAPSRSRVAPEIPTIEEAGGPPLHITTWRGLWAPRGTPSTIIEKLNAAVVEALDDPQVQKRVADIGQEIASPVERNPPALAVHHRAEMDRWRALIKAADETKH